MIERDAILRNLYTSGRIHEEGILARVDEALAKAANHPMDTVPKKISLKRGNLNEKMQMSTENLLRHFYKEPDDVCYFEFEGNSDVIDSKMYAAMKAVLNLGITPDQELANACSEIFKYLLDIRKDYKTKQEILEGMPQKTPSEKEVCNAFKTLWEIE